MDAEEVPPLMDGPGCRGWGPAGLCSGREPCCAGILDGDDRSFPVIGGATYHFNRKKEVSLVGGLKLGGELRVEDETGSRIADENYNSAVFLGLSFSVRF